MLKHQLYPNYALRGVVTHSKQWKATATLRMINESRAIANWPLIGGHISPVERLRYGVLASAKKTLQVESYSEVIPNQIQHQRKDEYFRSNLTDLWTSLGQLDSEIKSVQKAIERNRKSNEELEASLSELKNALCKKQTLINRHQKVPS